MKTYTFLIIVGLLSLGSSLCAQEIPTLQSAPLTLDYQTFASLVERAHPAQSLNQLAISRAHEAEKRAGVLMDPELSIGRDEIPLRSNEMRSGMATSQAMWKLNMTQMFPWPGTLDAEEASANAMTNKTRADANFTTAQVVFDAKEFFIRLVAAAKMAEVERENLNESLKILKNAEARLRQGLGSHQEVVQAENEKIVLSRNLSAMAGDLQNLKDYAALLIGREDAEGVTFVMDLLDPGTSDSSNSSAAKANDFRTEKLEAVRSEAVLKLEAEQKKSLPSLMVSGMVMQEDNGMQAYGVMAGIRIPLYSGSVRRSIGGEEAIVSRQASEELAWHHKKKKLAVAQNKRRNQVISANLLSLRTEVIPNSRQNLRVLTNAYGQGKGGLAAVNSARKLLLRYQLSQIMAERDLASTAISRQRIDAGFVDSELNQPLPQLISPEMATTSDMNGAQGMSGKSGGMKTQSRPMDKKSSSTQVPATGLPAGEENESAPSGTGMEGM